MADAAARARRLFVGVELDTDARAACAAVAEELQKTGLAAKYESPQKLHVTLAFLGNVEASRFDATVSTLPFIAKALAPFSLMLDKLGAFPHERKPRVVYIGSREQGAAFRALAQNARKAFAALGFSFDEDVVAHVTIARVKGATRPLPLVEVAPIRLEVQSIALFESLFDKQLNTSRYEIVMTAPLG